MKKILPFTQHKITELLGYQDVLDITTYNRHSLYSTLLPNQYVRCETNYKGIQIIEQGNIEKNKLNTLEPDASDQKIKDFKFWEHGAAVKAIYEWVPRQRGGYDPLRY